MKNPANLKPGTDASGWLLVDQLGNGVVCKATNGERKTALKLVGSLQTR